MRHLNFENKFHAHVRYSNIVTFEFNLDECCVHIEVYYGTKNEAYDYQSEVYGTYTKLSESVNGRSHYQSDFDNGAYGIWWCGAFWMISETSNLGTCYGGVGTIADINEKCVHNVGWDWEYADGDAWTLAGEGLGVKCTSKHDLSIIIFNLF